MTVRTGFSATKVLNGETIPDYSLEKTNNTTTMGKMIVAANDLLKRSKAPGVNGVVGTYDDTVVGEACHKIFNGAHAVNIYGINVTSQYFETSKLL